MSTEGGFGISFAEKFFGFILLIVGIFVLYYTIESASTLLTFTGFFGFLAAILVILGFVMMTARIEQ